jgi:peptidylprolyl isomerase
MLGALALAACGGSDPTPTPAPAPISTPTPAGPVAREPLFNSDGVRVAQAGDTVSVHYTGTLEDGTVFDSSIDGDPLLFTLGLGQAIDGFDAAVDGLAIGERVTTRIQPVDAYGEPKDALLIDVNAELLPPAVLLGDRVDLGNGTVVTIVAITDATVTLDANHELAGKVLTFEIELLDVQ